MDGDMSERQAAEAERASPGRRKGWLAGGSVIGALLASACCILPFVLLSLGIGGAWMSSLTALKPYQPYFIAATLVLLSAGFYNVYRKPRAACESEDRCSGGGCGSPLAARLTKLLLWAAGALVLLVLAWPYLAPYLLG